MSAITMLIGLAFVPLQAPAAADTACTATLKTDEIAEGKDGNWTIWLSVDTGKCTLSTGSFAYTLVIRRPGGDVEDVAQRASWASERPSSGFSITYRMTGEGKVEDAREFRDIRCSCGNR
jgi:hypothetical protein